MGQPIGPSARQPGQQRDGRDGRSAQSSHRDGRGDRHDRRDGRPQEGEGPSPPWMAEGGGGGKRPTMTAADVEAERQAMQEQFRKAKSAPVRRAVRTGVALARHTAAACRWACHELLVGAARQV